MRNRLLLVALLLCLAAAGYFTGLYQYLAPDRLREALTGAGPFGPILVIVLFALLEPFGTPGAIFMLAAATLWPFWIAFSINLLGATGAGMVGFAFARYLGRDWVEDRMPDRLRQWDERLSEKGLRAVVVFRLLFFLNPASHWALGLSRVRTSSAIIGTALGFAPGVAVFTYFGAEILLWAEKQSIWVWLAAPVVIIVIILIRRYRASASATSDVEVDADRKEGS
jgi:uncharacterized membrane protein YdjX (TVP38/TMEM64 family)